MTSDERFILLRKEIMLFFAESFKNAHFVTSQHGDVQFTISCVENGPRTLVIDTDALAKRLTYVLDRVPRPNWETWNDNSY